MSALTKLLIFAGLPTGGATLGAAAAVWVIRRRAARKPPSLATNVLKRTQAKLDAALAQLESLRKAAREDVAGDEPPIRETVVDRHNLTRRNRYVPYETDVRDKAWSDAAAILVEKYPGFKSPIKQLEDLKDQLLAGQPRPKTE